MMTIIPLYRLYTYTTPENLKWIKNDALEVWSLHRTPVVAFWFRDWNLQNQLTLIAPRSIWYISDRTPKPPKLYENLKSSEVKSAGPIPAFQEVLISDQWENEACVILSCIVSFGIVFTPGIFLTTEFDPGILKAEFSHSNEKKPYQNYKHIIYAVQKVKNKYIWHRER